MELTITSIAVAAVLLVLFGFLLGCAYYSWENHYRFKKLGSSEIEIGMRLGAAATPQFEFFGLQPINDLLLKGGRVLAVKEGAVLTRQTGTDAENVVMRWTGFTVKFEVTGK